jgi:hypothetical protein
MSIMLLPCRIRNGWEATRKARGEYMIFIAQEAYGNIQSSIRFNESHGEKLLPLSLPVRDLFNIIRSRLYWEGCIMRCKPISIK